MSMTCKISHLGRSRRRGRQREHRHRERGRVRAKERERLRRARRDERDGDVAELGDELRARESRRGCGRERDRERRAEGVDGVDERDERALERATQRAEGRSIQSDVGVEFKGVRWSSKASRAGIESEGWAERHDGKSP